MSSRDKNLPSEILTVSHFGFKYCSVDGEDSTSNDGNPKNENAKGVLNYSKNKVNPVVPKKLHFHEENEETFESGEISFHEDGTLQYLKPKFDNVKSSESKFLSRLLTISQSTSEEV